MMLFVFSPIANRKTWGKMC